MGKSIVMLSLFLAACAHSASTASRVNVSAADQVARRVDVRTLQRATRAAVDRADGAIAPSLTLTVFLESPGYVQSGLQTQTGRPGGHVGGLAVGYVPPEPWDAGLIVQHGDDIVVGDPANLAMRRPVVVGTYTISDASGAVREQRPIVVAAVDPEVAARSSELSSLQDAAQFLAARMVKISK
jgi:hypothetical protein